MVLEVDEEVISRVAGYTDLEYTMHVDDRVFRIENVSITKSKIPVRKPTQRGGVYFADTTAYKIKASTEDLSILTLLPKILFGPNTGFQPVEVRTSLIREGKASSVVLVSHVTNTMNTKSRVDLNLIVDGTKS